MGARGCTAVIAFSLHQFACIGRAFATVSKLPSGRRGIPMYDICGSGRAMEPPMGHVHGKPSHFSQHTMAVGAMKPHDNAIAMNGHGAAMVLP